MRRITLTLLCVLLTTSALRADSIWQRRVHRMSFLFHDTRAKQVGDVLVLLVQESSDVDNRDNRQLGKGTQSSGTVGLAGKTSGGFQEQQADGKLDVNSKSDRQFDGSASFRSAREFSDRISVTVQDVLPNGNLLITGKRHIRVSGDDRTLIVTGVVRPIDINPDNTVNSRFVADLNVSYEGIGDEQRFLRQGLGARLINRIWPF